MGIQAVSNVTIGKGLGGRNVFFFFRNVFLIGYKCLLSEIAGSKLLIFLILLDVTRYPCRTMC